MLPLLFLLFIAQLPPVPGETTLVSFCKQGRLSACQELRRVDPQKAAELEAEAAKALLRQEALRAAGEEAQAQEDAKAGESSGAEVSEAETLGEPPDCKGQEHHIISRRIAKALNDHKILHGIYKPRDERLKTRAQDEDSHCGYQDWHRKVDDNPTAKPEQFMRMLRAIYQRPEMLKRFPNGF